MALRAWAPVFTALEQGLGSEIFVALHGEWRAFQADAVRGTLADPETRAWVADADRRVTGFVTARLHHRRQLGEITMLAVDPDDQDEGIGTALTQFATDWLRGRGMLVSMVDTGGDTGHAPARRVYENSGYIPLPVVRYFKLL